MDAHGVLECLHYCDGYLSDDWRNIQRSPRDQECLQFERWYIGVVVRRQLKFSLVWTLLLESHWIPTQSCICQKHHWIFQ